MASIIGIAGPSCSGKTMLAHAIVQSLPDCAILPVDAYYRDLSHLTLQQRAEVNFDHPDAIEDALLIEHVRALREGRSVACPVYDFAMHTRLPQTRQVGPARTVIVEGLFALYWPELRAILDAAIFINIPDEECLARRLVRDIRERGRTALSVQKQYAQAVRPMYIEHCQPTSQHAQLSLNGCDPLPVLLQTAVAFIKKV